MSARTPKVALRRWLIFLLILAAVIIYVAATDSDHAQLARSFLRHLFRAIF